MERLLILDSNSLLNRAFYAIPPLTNSEGIHTNAVYGFTNMLFKMKEEIKPDYIVAAFDRKAPTFRHKEYEDYKAGKVPGKVWITDEIVYLNAYDEEKYTIAQANVGMITDPVTNEILIVDEKTILNINF